MANGLLTNILGFNPATVQQQRMQQFLAPIQQAQNPYERIGAALGTIGGGALFGMQDPQLQKASKVNQIMQSSLEGVDITDPTAYRTALLQLAGNLRDAGEPDAALYAASEASKLEAKKTKPMAVSPGQQLVNPETGEVIYTAPPKEEKPAEQRVRETRINELVTRGYSQQFATDIVDGNIRYEVVPQTGNVRRIDRLTGSVAEVPINNLPPQEQAALLAAEEESEKQTLWDAAEQGTGAWSSLRAGASRAFGQIPGVPQAQKTEEARQFLFSATNDLARSLVNNPRFPVAEVERVIREAGTQPSAFDTPELLRSRLKVLDGFLRDRLKTAEQDAANANLPQDVRVAQATNAASIRAFLPKLGVPEQGIGKPPRGVTMEQWRAMTPAQRDLFKSK
jgi:hypothetical protein